MCKNDGLRLGGTALLAVVLCAGVAAGRQPAPKESPKSRPQVEVVFCLDTTGSMDGLINAAKSKIWSICNQIAAGKPAPDLKIGLVPFRDHGDEYITKIYDLTDNLDAVHKNLMSFEAKGGGDIPEAVNQALYESVTKISWSKDKKTLKMIFLVGDAPPKYYKEDVPYQETCKIAVKNDIIINTIQCGDMADTEKVWKDICHLAEGSYVRINAQGGPVVVYSTPYDKELAKINSELTATTLTFGPAQAQNVAESFKQLAKELKDADAAERAAYYANSKTQASYDLLYNIQCGKVKLEQLKKDELPPQLQKLSLTEQQSYLSNIDKVRKELTEKALDLDKKRKEFIAQQQKKKAKDQSKESFDHQMLQIIQIQAKRINVQYEPTPTTKPGAGKKSPS